MIKNPNNMVIKKSLTLASPASLFAMQSLSQNNIGMGTTTPNAAYRLDVVGGANLGALRMESAGNGPLIIGFSNGSGNGMNLVKSASSSGLALFVEHFGPSGNTAQFKRETASGSGTTIFATNNSNQPLSPVIFANHTGTGDAAIIATINNAANAFAAVYGETNGAGAGIYGGNTGSGPGVFATSTNGSAVNAQASGVGHGVVAIHTGSGNAVFGSVTTGTGRAGQFQITNASNSQPAVRGFTSGTGQAGLFTINNSASTAPALLAESNGSGPAVEARTLVVPNGLALRLSEGGVTMNVEALSSGTAISRRATAYLLTGGGPYSFSFALNNGDLFFIFNSSASAISVGGVSIPANAGRTCMVMGGILRAW
jgi:hypothetical protein